MYNPAQVIDKVLEAQNIYSFYLKPSGDKKITDFQPGQHVNVRLSLPGLSGTLTRPYTLSSAPGQSHYRITVKWEGGHSRSGLASSFLHDHVHPGDTLWISEPQGTFVLPKTSRRPVVLISAGVGITPMLSMIETIALEHNPRTVWVFHGSKNKEVQPMGQRLKTLAGEHENIRVSIHHSQPSDSDVVGIDYDRIGRIDLDFLKRSLPDLDADFYLCGPSAFIQTLSDGLRFHGVPDSGIAYEYFGAVPTNVLSKTIPELTSEKKQELSPIRVSLANSNQTFLWSDSYGSILELLEANEIFPPSSCRLGTCMSCSTGLLSGTVTYEPEPLAEPFDGDILLCCARPQTDLQLDL